MVPDSLAHDMINQAPSTLSIASSYGSIASTVIAYSANFIYDCGDECRSLNTHVSVFEWYELPLISKLIDIKQAYNESVHEINLSLQTP